MGSNPGEKCRSYGKCPKPLNQLVSILAGSLRGCKKLIFCFFAPGEIRRGSPFDNKTLLGGVPQRSPGAHTQRARRYGLSGPFGSLPGSIFRHFGPIFDRNPVLRAYPGPQGSKIVQIKTNAQGPLSRWHALTLEQDPVLAQEQDLVLVQSTRARSCSCRRRIFSSCAKTRSCSCARTSWTIGVSASL